MNLNYIDILGLTAGGLTTFSLIPQIKMIIKTKSTKDISLGTYLLYIFGIICWLIYGIYLVAMPIIISNTLSLIMSLTILAFKIKYK